MKTFSFLKAFVISAMALATITGCSKDEVKDEPAGAPSILVNGKASELVTVGLTGGTLSPSVTVQSSNVWSMSLSANSSWLHPSITSGDKGASTLTFTADAVPAGGEARTAVVTLMTTGSIAGYQINATATINVRQGDASATNVATIRQKLVAMNPTSTKVDVTPEIAAMTITGIVVSDFNGSNWGNDFNIAVQDASGEANSGLTLNANAFSTAKYAVGTVVSIPLTKAQVNAFNGELQVAISNDVTAVVTPGAAPEPIVVTVDKLNDYMSQLVKIEKCQPVSSIVGKTWTDVFNTASMETPAGASFVINTGKKAAYAANVIPDKSGPVIGIGYVAYNGTPQLKPRNVADLAGLTEARFPLSYTEKTISQITAAGNYIVKNGVVVANFKNGFLMNDGTGYMLVYQFVDAATPITIPAPGKKVDIKGTVESYGINGGVLQFGNKSLTVTETGTGTAPAATLTTLNGAAVTALAAAPEIKYVKYTGKMVVADKFYNVTIDGTTVVGSIAYPNDDLNVASFDGKFVDVEGWVYGVSTKSNVSYLQTLTTKLTENTSVNSITADDKAQFAYDATSGTVAFSANVVAGNKVFAKLNDATWFSVPSGAISGNSVAVTMKANETDAAKTATLTIYIAASEGGEALASATVALTQAKKPSGGDGAPYAWVMAKDDIPLAGGAVTKGEPAMDWASTALPFVGWDTNAYQKGVQFGSSKLPATAYTLSTTAYSGNVSSIKINASIGSGGDGKLTVKVNGVQVGETVSLVLDATDYTFTPATPVAGNIEISLAATAKAMYIKSIDINPVQ